MIIRRIRDDELYHFGIKGQKWGVRRYQNPDGSLTNAGRGRYGSKNPTDAIKSKIPDRFKKPKKPNEFINEKIQSKTNSSFEYKDGQIKYKKRETPSLSDGRLYGNSNNRDNDIKRRDSDRGFNISPEAKKRIKIAAGVVGGLTLAAAAAYIGYKYGGNIAKSISEKKPAPNPLKMANAKREAELASLKLMSDDDLKKGISRFKLEKEYTDLANQTLHKSRTQIDDVIERAGKATLYTLLVGASGYGIRAAVTGVNDKDILADYIAPKPKNNRKR